MEKERKSLAFIDYVNEDKSQYPFSNTIEDPRTGKSYIDDDNDFRVGNSGGFLMNIDFTLINTHLFTKVAEEYESNRENRDIRDWIESMDVPATHNRGKYYYCPYAYGTRQYKEFWDKEKTRRKNGMTAKCKLKDGKIYDLHITGDHYTYLNYSRILRTPTEEEQVELHSKGDYKTTQIEKFPRFWDGDYWNFKTDLFIARNKYHLTKGKARGKGYSYKRGSQAANTINSIPKVTVILAAYDISYLTDPQATSDMVKTNLDWFEENTDWKRLYLSENYKTGIELGYKTKKGGNKKFGWRSKLLSETLFNNESAAIGKRAIEIDVEEAGKCPNLLQFLGVTQSSTEVGATNVGTIRVYGTAGTKDANWMPFAETFYNPRRFKMMPFENVWDINARGTVCGFFHPQVWNLEPFMDIDGNSQLEAAYAWDLEDKASQQEEKTIEDYIVYVAQRANSPEEAFRKSVDNIFGSVELSNHMTNVLSNKELHYYRDGMVFDVPDKGVEFKTNMQLVSENLTEYAHPYIVDVPFNSKKDFYGCIREYAPPMKLDGVVPDDLYYITFDSVGKDKDSSAVINRNSLNSAQVLMYPNNTFTAKGDNIVAAWAGRPNSMSEANAIIAKMCRYYNAKVIPEVDRGTLVEDFKKWGLLHYIHEDPTNILSNKQKEAQSVGYGINIGSGDLAQDGLLYLKDWLYRKRAVREDGSIIYTFHYIYDLPLLKELTGFNINGNFDRISSLRVGVILLKAKQVRARNDILNASSSSNIYEDIGLYGYKG